MTYDYLIVGAGLFGSVFAREAADAGKKVLVIDKRDHIGGNCYTERVSGIEVHRYGAHIFHTNDKEVWEFVTRFASFNDYVHELKANYKGKLYSLPFNMNTFREMWGVTEPEEARAIIEGQRRGWSPEDVAGRDADCAGQSADGTGRTAGREEPGDRQLDRAQPHAPRNLEEQAIALVGRDIYEKLIKGYTEKQWGRSCRELPAFIIRRLPVRFEYNNNYYDAKYQGIPVDGYTAMIERMLDGIEVRLGTDYLGGEAAAPVAGSGRSKAGSDGRLPDAVDPAVKASFDAMARKVIYTGPLDRYFNFELGRLAYRGLRFETEKLDEPDFQGHPVVNYTDRKTPWTRIIEHKWFTFGRDLSGQPLPGTVITREYPAAWQPGDEPYYPVNDEVNEELAARYRERASAEKNVFFGGRLGEYRYYDMDQVVRAALDLARREMGL